MLDQYIWTTIRFRWVKIFAIIVTTIIIMTAAGIEVAAFSSAKSKRSARRSSPPPVATCTAQPSGMVGWWTGNGNPNDLINGNNGSLVNGVTYVPGMVGQAFSLTQANQQFVDVPGAASYLLNNSAGTIAAWVNPSSVGDNDIIVAFGTGNNGEGVGIGIYGTVRIYHHTGAFDWQTSTPVSASTWTYLVYTWDGTSETLYKNGVFAESRARNFNYVPAHSRIGYGFWNDPVNFFPGQIDEVAIFNRTLSAGEVLAIYNAGSAGVCPACAPPPVGMISWWPAESDATDRMGMNNAVLQGNAGFVSGKVGNSFSLDGNGDYASVAAPSGLPVGNSPRTVELWFKAPATPGESGLFQYGTPAEGQMFGLITSGNAPGRLYFYGHSSDVAANTVIQPDVWYHGAVTYDGTGVKIYINGQMENAVAMTLGTVVDSNGITIGHRAGGSYWTGEIDEPTIYDRALSDAEIFAIYNSGITGKCSTCAPAPVGLESWWTGDGNGLDARGRNNAVMNGGAAFAAGLSGQAFSFNGTTAHALTATATGIDGGPQATYQAWVNPAATPDVDAYFAFLAVGDTTQGQWTPMQCRLLYWRTGDSPAGKAKYYADCGLDNNDNYIGRMSAQDYAINTWSFVSVTFKNGSLDLYVNGVLDNGALTGTGGSVLNTNFNKYVSIGAQVRNSDGSLFVPFNGRVDDIAIYNRALTPAEIKAVFAGGNFGMCRPTATTPPAGVVGWWGGDGFVSDISGNANHGTLINGTGFAVGKVGQTFKFDGVDDYISVPDSPALNPTSQITIESWVFPVSDFAGGSDFSMILNKETESISPQYEIARKNSTGCTFGGPMATGNLGFAVSGLSGLPADCNGWVDGYAYLPLNTWSHIALTYDGSNARVYLNGEITRTIPANGAIATSTGELRIGTRTVGVGPNSAWKGMLDEVTIYNRAITPAEIQAIVNAGLAGKLKQAATLSNGSRGRKTSAPNVGFYALAGDATIYFPAVNLSGMTHEIPLDPALLPPLPLQSVGLTYDIATSAQYTGTPTVCFNLPSFNITEFATLHILHLENGGWVDVTYNQSAYPSLCAVGLTSLSPFAIVTTAPTAAELSIAGRVVTTEGRGIRGAFVTVTGTGGDVRTVPTGNLGRYTVEGLNAGETYIVTVRSRRFTFAQPTRVITLNDNVKDADFIGSSGTGRER